MAQQNAICEFRGEYAFLSNFFESEIYCWGYRYRNAEAAFQGIKDPLRADMFEGVSAKSAKKLGRQLRLRADWEEVKERFMLTACLAKFTQNPELGEKLLATGNRELIEINTWCDVEWASATERAKICSAKF